MWEAIGGVLSSPNAGKVLVFLAAATVLAAVLVASGRVTVRTKHLHIGKAEKEREIIRRQVEAAHEFILSIDGKINAETAKCNGYYVKYILERVYDKVIEWIMFNHIASTPMYIQDKQDTICNLVYMFAIGEEFKTPEFKKRMCSWVQELITRLVQIRDLYGKGE